MRKLERIPILLVGLWDSPSFFVESPPPSEKSGNGYNWQWYFVYSPLIGYWFIFISNLTHTIHIQFPISSFASTSADSQAVFLNLFSISVIYLRNRREKIFVCKLVFLAAQAKKNHYNYLHLWISSTFYIAFFQNSTGDNINFPVKHDLGGNINTAP